MSTGELQGAPVANAAAHEEAALVARVAAGDNEDAMEALCARYAAPLFALGVRLLGDRGMAEEMVQDSFVRLWRSADRFDPERGSVKTFLYTIARRVAIDLRRRASSRPLTTPGGDEETSDLPKGAGGEDEFERIVIGMDVRDALESLSGKHRETLELHYHEDLTQQQIADRLGIPLGTVKTRTYHALRALKTQLEERGIAAR